MEKIIENLQLLVDSIDFVEQEHSANYVIEANDKKLLIEALNEALHLHSIGSKRPDIEAFRKHIENMSDEKFDKIVSEIEHNGLILP